VYPFVLGRTDRNISRRPGLQPVPAMTDPGPPLPFHRRSIFLAVPFFAFFTVLALVEVAVRLTLPHLSSLDVFVASPRQQAQFVDAAHVRIFEGDPLLVWRLTRALRGVLWGGARVPTTTVWP